jgi:hypothetical protein
MCQSAQVIADRVFILLFTSERKVVTKYTKLPTQLCKTA